MFEKFLKNQDCIKVLSWLLNHPDGEYTAAIIGIESEIADMTTYMAVLSILEGVGLITINEVVEELSISLNKEASITQLLIHLKDEFNDNAFKSEQVSPALAYLSSNPLRKIVDGEIFSKISKDVNDLADKCRNYKDLDLSITDNMDIYNLCSKLEETGEYEEFISRLDESTKK